MNKNRIKFSWTAALLIVSVSFFSACVKKDDVVSASQAVQSGSSPSSASAGVAGANTVSDAANPIGMATIRNYNSLFTALRMCMQVNPSAASTTYFSQAQLVLPADSQVGSLNDSVVNTGVMLAGYVAQDFINTELSKPAANRLALGMVPLTATATTSKKGSTTTTTYTYSVTTGSTLTGFNAATVFTNVAQNIVSMCYGSVDASVSSAAVTGAVTAATTALGSGTPTALLVEQATLVVLTGILGAPPMLASNGI